MTSPVITTITTTKKTRRSKGFWQNEIVEELKKILNWYKEQYPPKPTLRTLFYRLVSQKHLDNTASEYNQLSTALVVACKKRKLPWDCIVDQGRQVLEESEIIDDPEFLTPELLIDVHLNKLKQIPQDYRDKYTGIPNQSASSVVYDLS